MVRTRSSAAAEVTKSVLKAKSKAKAVIVRNNGKKQNKNKDSQELSLKAMRIKILDIVTPLSTALIVSRPSTTIKTPYLADILPSSSSSSSALVKDFQKSVESVVLDISSNSKAKSKELKEISSTFASKHIDKLQLAHAPSLDCAGMVIPGSIVYTSASTSSTTKSDCVIQFCEELREDGSYTRVGYHPFLAEKISKELLNKHLVDEVASYNTIEAQQTYGKSRVDFVLKDSLNKTMTLLEVKNVVGADYPQGAVPAARSPIGVYEALVPDNAGHSFVYERSAIFPHGAVKSGIGVVSDRAIKHIHDLTQMHGTIDGASGARINSAILFVVNRSDCTKFRPCHEACMLFAQMLHRAVKMGVVVIAKEVIWEDTIAYLGKSLPVVFSDVVDESEIDEKHLRAVLDFNESNGGKN